MVIFNSYVKLPEGKLPSGPHGDGANGPTSSSTSWWCLGEKRQDMAFLSTKGRDISWEYIYIYT